jgi:hypothetical protein
MVVEPSRGMKRTGAPEQKWLGTDKASTSYDTPVFIIRSGWGKRNIWKLLMNLESQQGSLLADPGPHAGVGRGFGPAAVESAPEVLVAVEWLE